MDKQYTISIEGIKKKFHDQKVLDGIYLQCEPGKCYGIVGYNGSGKSVLFKCICGLMNADEGKIFINGKDIHKDKGAMLDCGFIIEEPSFLKEYSGYRNLEYLYGINHKKDRMKLENMLTKVGLDPKLKKHVGKYSMGMRQRLGIAQAIMEDPDILILDEPMNGLDKKGVEEMRSLFLTLKEANKTILLASHNREDIEKLCDQVYEIQEGVLEQI